VNVHKSQLAAWTVLRRNPAEATSVWPDSFRTETRRTQKASFTLARARLLLSAPERQLLGAAWIAAGGRFFSVEIKKEWIERVRECIGATDLDSSLHEGDLAWLATRLYREHKQMDACSMLTVEGLVLEMLAIVGRVRNSERNKPRWLSRVVDLLHAEYRNNLKVQDIANEIGVHPFHLSRVFRTVHRETIGEYVQKLRVKYACEQLAMAENDLATVALSAGFADQSHFTRVFKSVTGTTPGAYRQIVTNKN